MSDLHRSLLEEALQLERQLHIALLADKMTQQEEQQQQKADDQEQQEEGEERQEGGDADAAAAGSLAIPGGFGANFAQHACRTRTPQGAGMLLQATHMHLI